MIAVHWPRQNGHNPFSGPLITVKLVEGARWVSLLPACSHWPSQRGDALFAHLSTGSMIVHWRAACPDITPSAHCLHTNQT